MTVPKSYEALAADLASEKILSKTLQGQKETYMILADERKAELDAALASEALLKRELEIAAEQVCATEGREVSLREELEAIKRVGPPHFCGLPMSLNPHAEAGKPGRFLEVGAHRECIPCLVSSRHGWAKTAGELQQRLTVAEQLLRETSDYLDGSTRNAVWCDSILHKKMKAALKPAAEGEGS